MHCLLTEGHVPWLMPVRPHHASAQRGGGFFSTVLTNGQWLCESLQGKCTQLGAVHRYIVNKAKFA